MGGGLVVGSTSDLAGDGIIYATNDIHPDNRELGLGYGRDTMMNPGQHFDGSSRPSGWSKSGSGSDTYTYPSNVRLTGVTSATFLYKTRTTSGTFYAAVSPLTIYNNASCGIRLELSSSSNYFCQYLIVYQSSDGTWQPRIQYRSGDGDSLHEVIGHDLYGYPAPFHIGLSLNGTRWSSWGALGIIRSPNSPGYAWSPNASSFGLNWTPNRVGFIAQPTGATWESFWCDYFHET